MGSTFPVSKGAISSLVHCRARFGARCRTVGYILIMRFDRLSMLQIYTAYAQKKNECINRHPQVSLSRSEVFEDFRICNQ